MDNGTSRKEVVIAVDSAFYVIKHYAYTLENDIAGRKKVAEEGGLPKITENPEQAKLQLEHNRDQRKPIAELLTRSVELKNLLDNGEITYRDCEPFSDRQI